jgi:hypothetical protein
VERTSMAVGAVGEDPVALGEVVVSEDPVAVGEAAVVEVVGGQGGVEANAEEKRARGVDPMVVGEAPTVDLTAVGDATVVQAWRCTIEEGARRWRRNDSS